MTSQPLTFGVELEFALFYVPNRDPDPPGFDDKRTFRFSPIATDLSASGKGSKEPSMTTARRHVATTIHEAGHDVNLNMAASGDTTKWESSTDPSVCGPNNSSAEGPFHIWGMEVKSPVLEFCIESIRAVQHVVMLLSRTYLININDTVGLHIHVGNQRHGYSFENVRKLTAFFWAFEPQLSSIHPPARQQAYYACSTRDDSQYTYDMESSHQRRPKPLEGASFFLNFQGDDQAYYDNFETRSRFREIIHFQRRNGGSGKSAYNFYNLLSNFWALGTSPKLTIEFRQHEGSLNAPAITAWIETVVGLINFVQDVHPSSLAALLSVVENETWEKEGDGQDQQREERLGPILAEGGLQSLIF